MADTHLDKAAGSPILLFSGTHSKKYIDKLYSQAFVRSCADFIRYPLTILPKEIHKMTSSFCFLQVNDLF